MIQPRRFAVAPSCRSRKVRAEQTAPAPGAIATGTPLAEAAETYFKNLEKKKQDMLDFMGWMRKQPLPKRRHSNPNRTYNNKVSYVAIFLKEFGVSRLLKKKEYPQYHKKKVVAHPENELSVLYGHANEKERFLLDFFIGSMVTTKHTAVATPTSRGRP
jgi:hypothetical protein